MSMDGNGLSVADALALGRDGNGMFGDGNGSWIFFLFFLLAWGGNFGNWGGNGMNSTASAYTDSAIQRGFDNQAVMNKLNGLESGLCDGFYAVNTSLLNGFNGTQQAINNVAVAGMQNTNALASQLADCCCTTQRSIDAVRYENARNTCDIVNAIKADGDATRALMTQNEIQSLRDQLQTANFQLSQQAQNATLISTLRPTPIPAYQTCSPYESAQMFSHYRTACNNVCGC